LDDFFGAAHVVGKIEGAFAFADSSSDTEIGSIEGRLQYTAEGINLMKENPVSLLVGHPGYMAMFNGDGLWISFIVTHGMLFTLLFLLVNLYALIRCVRRPEVEFVFSFFVLAIFQAFFITNRIL